MEFVRRLSSNLTDKSEFETEVDCIKFLELKKWNGKPTCPKCGNNHNNYRYKTRKIYRCSNTECKSQFSLTQGTIFQNSNLPLKVWFQAIRLHAIAKAHKPITSIDLSEYLGVQQKTAWIMLQKIRETMRDENKKAELSGYVEADETYIGSRPERDLRLRDRMNKYAIENPDRDYEYEHLKGVFGAIERYTSKLVLRKIGWHQNCFTKEISTELMTKHINTISTVITDEHHSYFTMHQYFHSHWKIAKQRRVKRKRKDGSTYSMRTYSYVDGKTHVNNIENVFKYLKKTVDSYIHFCYKHTDRYLDEFSFRWNRKHKPVFERLEEVIENSIGKTITYTQLKFWDLEYQKKPWNY